MDMHPPLPTASVDVFNVAWMLSPTAADFAAETIELLGDRVPDDYLDAALLLVEDVFAAGLEFDHVDGAALARAVHRILDGE